MEGKVVRVFACPRRDASVGTYHQYLVAYEGGGSGELKDELLSQAELEAQVVPSDLLGGEARTSEEEVCWVSVLLCWCLVRLPAA